jgi:nucleotide-binding universal stress UspA family protein
MISITVGVDDERATAVAVDWLIRRYRDLPAHITLVTAYDLLTDEPFADGEVLDRYAGKLRAALPNAVVGVVLSEGSIPRVLEERSRRADLLVIGSHRTRHGRSVLTGRLPLRVARQAGCPVVVVPDDVRPRGGRRVVAGVDARDSAAVLDVAAAEARALHLPLHLLHAWEPPAMPVDLQAAPDALLAEQARHRAVLAEAGDRTRTFGVPVQEELFEGAHRDRLRELSRSAALVVVGSGHAGSFAELLTGSTVARLLRESRAAVCVVPGRIEADGRAEARLLATLR